MFTTYSTVAGDTFGAVSRKVYGTEIHAEHIARANPGTVEPLPTGVGVIVPPLPDAPPSRVAGLNNTNNPSEVALFVNGSRFRFWEKIRIERSLDAIDLVEFAAPFEIDAPGFKETFRPFSFLPASISVGGEHLFTGTMLTVDPSIETNRKTVTVGCYSTPGALEDCTASAASFPLEFNDQGLREIAAAIAAPFGVDVVFTADPGAVFERVAAEAGKKAMNFLVGLAKQRGLIISSTPEGALLFQQSAESGAPVARLVQGQSPLVKVNSLFRPQEYYSHITGLEAAFIGLPGQKFTVRNPLISSVVRPFSFEVPDTVGGDVKGAVEAKAGRMFGNVVSYEVEVDTWRDPAGNLWRPNTTLTLTAPGVMVYSEYELLIRSVLFEREGDREAATLNLTLLGAFSGKMPEVLPWDV